MILVGSPRTVTIVSVAFDSPRKGAEPGCLNRRTHHKPVVAPARDFLLPRLVALVDNAVAAGIQREVAVAVIIDIATAPPFDTALPDPDPDANVPKMWDRGPDSVVLVAGLASEPRPIDARDPADFVKPFGGMEPS